MITILEKIVRLTKSSNVIPMKKWSLRSVKDKKGKKSWLIKKIRSEVKAILNLISGGEITEMLKGKKIIKCQ
jgi:hypothetical protein